MDFKALTTQILANVDNYDENESRIIIRKLCDFLEEINEKRSQLEIENRQLFEEINNKHNLEQNKNKVDEIFQKANFEAKNIIEKAKTDANQKIVEAEDKSKEIVTHTINKLEDIVTEIKNLDQEMKLYRSNILNIFKKTIFKFSDTNYYLIRKDDKDFNDLLNFFETDSRLQLLVDENLKKLNTINNYIEIRDSVKNKVNEVNLIHSFEEILKGNEIEISENKELTVQDKEVIEKSINLKEQEIIKKNEVPSKEKEVEKGSKKFIDILSKYNNK